MTHGQTRAAGRQQVLELAAVLRSSRLRALAHAGAAHNDQLVFEGTLFWLVVKGNQEEDTYFSGRGGEGGGFGDNPTAAMPPD